MSYFDKLKEIFSFFSKIRIKNPFRRESLKLFRLWKSFLRQIPPSLRTSVQSYPRHFIVLGDNSSGKSQFIQKYTEREQAFYALKSNHLSEPGIQFSIGPKSVIQELSWNLIEDRSLKVRKQLVKLWQRLCSKREAVVVLVFNFSIFEKYDAKRIHYTVMQLLNTIVTLSEVVKKPIPVRIAFTHCDKINGYQEFSQFLHRQGKSLDVDLTSYSAEHTLKEMFKSYEKYISLSLVHSSSENYLKILEFFRTFPRFFSSIDQFLYTFKLIPQERNALIYESLIFTSQAEGDQSSYPFKGASPSHSFLRTHYQHHKHQLVCCGIIALGLVYFGTKFIREKLEVKQLSEEIAELEFNRPLNSLATILPSMEVLNKKRPYDPFMLYLPSFFRPAYSNLSQRFMLFSQAYVLAPVFRQTFLDQRSEVKNGLLLGLMSATKNNRLGHLLLEHSKECATAIQLPEHFLRLSIHLQSGFSKNPVDLKHFYLNYLPTPLANYEPWTNFIEQLHRLAEKPYVGEEEIEGVQQEAATLLTALNQVKQYPLIDHVSKCLEEEGPLETRQIFSRQAQVINWLKESEQGWRDLLALIGQSPLKFSFSSEVGLSSFLDLLLPKETKNQSFSFTVDNQPYEFESSAWHQVIITQKIKQAVQKYISDNSNSKSKILFRSTPDFFNLEFAYLEDDFPKMAEKKSIPGAYTHAAYKKNIFPLAGKLAKIIDSNLVDFETKNQLNKFVSKEIDCYVKDYKKHYEEVFNLFGIHPNSLEEAKNVLARMSEPLSHFPYLLFNLKTNLRIPTSSVHCLQSMNHLSEFQFLDSLLSDDMNEPAQLSKYQEILNRMLGDLNKKKKLYSEPAEDLPVLQNHLSPVAKMSFEIITQQPTSYLSQANQWLQEANIPYKYHDFFLQPILQVHEIGLKELKTSIEHVWKTTYQPQVAALFSKFPFNQSASQSATLEEITRLVHPQQRMWQDIHQLISPVSLKKNGQWTALYPEMLNLDPQLYQAVNQLSRLSGTLWDTAGKPQPLEMKVRTVPFKNHPTNNKFIILNYLISGNESLFNINQTPSHETLKVHWWNPDSSRVGIEEYDPLTKKTAYCEQKVENCLWSFHQLLNKAAQKDAHFWTWQLPTNSNAVQQQVAIHFENNPWDLFK